MHYKMLPIIAAACAIVMLTGCSTTTIDSEWVADQAGARTYQKILVVGVSEDFDRRRSFENFVVNALQNSGNTAWPSSRLMESETPLDEEAIRATVNTSGADAILVTRLVDRSVTADEVDARTGLKTQRKEGGLVNLFRYDYNEYEEPAYIVAKNAATLSTELFEAGQGNLVFKMESTTTDKESIHEVIEEASAAIVKRLRRDGLVR
jgi:hypothetical protein